MRRAARVLVVLTVLVLAARTGYAPGREGPLTVAADPTTTSARSSFTTTTTSTSSTTTSTSTSTTTTSAPAPTSTLPPTTEPPSTVPVTESPETVPETVPPSPPPPPPPGDGSRVLMVGDSVMLGAQPDLEALAGWAVAVDAAVSRQVGPPYVNNGLDAIAAGHVPGDGRVVVHLGTNGRFTDAQLDQMMELLADVPRVVLVTVTIPTYPDIEADNNAMILNAPSRYPKIVVVDWKGACDANPAWLGSDGIHPTADGRAAYASLVGAAL